MNKTIINTKPPEKLLRAVEIADILSVSRAFAYKLMQQRKIRTVIIDGARRVRPEDLRNFIEESLDPTLNKNFAE